MDSYTTYQKSPHQQEWQSSSSTYRTHDPSQSVPNSYQEPPPPYPIDHNSFRSPTQRYQYVAAHSPVLERNYFHDQTIGSEQYASRLSTLPFHQYSTSAVSRPASSYSQTPSSPPPSDEAFLSEALAFTQQTPQTPFQITRLQSPIAIPQTIAAMGGSFLRAWAPMLRSHDISIVQFIAFIDNLNVVSTASPPLQAMSLAGGVLGMVPHHWAMIAGNVIQTTANLGTFAVSKGRTELYMREVNEKMFKPRGLKVSIAKTEAIRSVLRVPTGRPMLPPLNAQTVQMGIAERVLLQLWPYNAVLDLNVPPPAEQTTMLAKLSAKQIAAQAKRNQSKLIKKHEKDLRKEGEQERKEERKDEKRRRKEEKKARKRERKHAKGRDSSDSDSSLESDREKHRHGKKDKTSKEEKKAGKLLWVLIEKL